MLQQQPESGIKKTFYFHFRNHQNQRRKKVGKVNLALVDLASLWRHQSTTEQQLKPFEAPGDPYIAGFTWRHCTEIFLLTLDL